MVGRAVLWLDRLLRERRMGMGEPCGVYGAGDGGGSEELLGDGEEAGEDHVAVDHHAQLVGIEPAAEL